MTRLVALVVGFWVARWALLELAAYAGRHWLPAGRPSNESRRQPGRMPGPFER